MSAEETLRMMLVNARSVAQQRPEAKYFVLVVREDKAGCLYTNAWAYEALPPMPLGRGESLWMRDELLASP